MELAAVVGERLRGSTGGAVRVRLVTPGSCILPHAPQGQREVAERTLAGLGVETLTGEERGGGE